MPKKKSKASCHVDHLELRRLLSTIYVSASATGANNGSSWTDAYTNLQTAIAAAHSGTVIDVGQGTYTPGADRTDTFHLADGVTLAGGFAGTGQPFPNAHNDTSFPSILSGDIGTTGVKTDNIYNVVTGSGTDSSAVLNGFTVSGGFANGTHYYEGGGIHNVSGSPTISYCVIQNNYADSAGGGISNFSSSPTITHCTITDDTSGGSGGGMENLETSAPMVTYCDFSDNSASNSQSGGAVANSFTTAPTFMNCSFTGNSAEIGGAVDNFESTTSFENCIFSGNSAHLAGGAIENISCSPNLINCVLSGNTAQTDKGGAMYNQDASPTLTNCTITGNTAVLGGALANSQSDSSPILTNCILWGNTATTYNEIYNRGGSATVTYSDIDQSGFSNTGDADTDPLFVDAAGTHGSTDFGDLHLTINSPLINAGSNAAVSGVGTDFDGNARIIYGTVDMGAYEFTAIKIVITGQAPISTPAGNTFSVTAHLEDSAGNTVAMDNSEVSIAILTGPTGAILGGTTPVNAQSGVVTFNDLSLTKAGSYTLTLTDQSLTSGTTNTFSITAGSAMAIAITQQPSGAGAGEDLGTADVAVEDQYGNVVTTDHSLVTASSTGLSGTQSVSAASGVAAFTDLSFIALGNHSITFQDGSFPAEVSHSFNVSPGAPALLVILTQPTGAVAGTTLGATTVAVEDTFGNIVTGDTSHVTVTTSASGFGGTKNVPTINGVATFNDLALTQAGTFTLNFADSDDSLSTIPSNQFTITPGDAALLAFTNVPQGQTAGVALPAFEVNIEDSFHNIITSDNSTVTLSTSSDSGLGGTLSAVAQSGVATFDNVSLTNASIVPALTASDGSLTGISTGITIVPGAADRLDFTTEPADALAGQTLAPIVVEVKDRYGNLVTNDNSTIELTSGLNSTAQNNAIVPSSVLTEDSAVSVAAMNGVATFSDLSYTKANPYFFVATDGALEEGVSTGFTINPAAPVLLSIESQPANSVIGQTTPTVVVIAEDQYGNITDDDSNITLAIASGPAGSILGGTVTESASANGADFLNLSLNRAGTYTLSVSDGNLPTLTTNSFTVTYAGPQLVFVTEPNNAVAGAKISAIHVSPEDINGNPLTTNKSKITIRSSAGKLLGTSTASVKNGVAIFKNLSFQQAGSYTFQASDSGFGSTLSNTIIVAPSAATKMAFTPQPANVVHGTPFNVTIDLFDRYGNLATNNSSTVELTLGSKPATATFTNLMAIVTDGAADFDGAVLSVPGTYTLAAIDGKLKAKSGKFVVG